MADPEIKISELDAATQANATDLLEASQVSGAGYVTKKLSLDLVTDLVAASDQISDAIEAVAPVGNYVLKAGDTMTGPLTITDAGVFAALKLTETAAGGRSYWMTSTSNAAGVGGGKWGLWDNTAGVYRLTVDSVGAAAFSGPVRVGPVAASAVPGQNWIQAPGIWAVDAGQGAIGAYDTTAGHIGAYIYSNAGSAGIALINNAGGYAGSAMTFSPTAVTMQQPLTGTLAGFGAAPLANVSMRIMGLGTTNHYGIFYQNSAGTERFSVQDDGDTFIGGSLTATIGTFSGSVTVGAGQRYVFSGRGFIDPLNDGLFGLFNAAGTAGVRLDVATTPGTIQVLNGAGGANNAKIKIATPATATNDETVATTAFVQAALGSAQTVSFQTGAVATGTTTIPFDDTIPQITEGNEYMTLAITPKSATSRLIIEVVWNGSSSIAGTHSIAVALFQDSTANALVATFVSAPASAFGLNAKLTHAMTSGTTSATTFRVRAGTGAAGTTTFNGFGAARAFGGVMASSIVIREVAA